MFGAVRKRNEIERVGCNHNVYNDALYVYAVTGLKTRVKSVFEYCRNNITRLYFIYIYIYTHDTLPIVVQYLLLTRFNIKYYTHE